LNVYRVPVRQTVPALDSKRIRRDNHKQILRQGIDERKDIGSRNPVHGLLSDVFPGSELRIERMSRQDEHAVLPQDCVLNGTGDIRYQDEHRNRHRGENPVSGIPVEESRHRQ